MSLAHESLSGAVVAFDLDGTLVDSAPDLIGALNVVLHEQGLPHLPLKQARVMVGRGTKGLLRHGFSAAGAKLDEGEMRGLVRRYIEVYRSRIAQESLPFPGVEAALVELAGAGARLCVCTNKFTDLSLALLEALGLNRHFAAVIGMDLAPAQKPDPRHLITAIETVGGHASRALMVGDSASDVGAARGAGVPSVVVGFGYTEIAAAELGGDHLIEHFSELPPLAARLL